MPLSRVCYQKKSKSIENPLLIEASDISFVQEETEALAPLFSSMMGSSPSNSTVWLLLSSVSEHCASKLGLTAGEILELLESLCFVRLPCGLESNEESRACC